MKREVCILSMAIGLSACEFKTAEVPPPPPVAQARKVTLRSELPDAAKRIIRGRMKRHADDAMGLLYATLGLNYKLAAEHARSIAAEPRLARPIEDDASSLNANIPEGFFAFQNRLGEAAEAFAQAAEANDVNAMSEKYAELSQTCIGCHTVYRDAGKKQEAATP